MKGVISTSKDKANGESYTDNHSNSKQRH